MSGATAPARADLSDPSRVSVSVAGGMVVRDGLVLLGRRAPHRRICPDTWDLIGGHLKPGETPEHALVREFREEIGAEPIDFFLSTLLDFSQEAGKPLYYALYRIGGLDAEPRLANAEHTELRWFNLRQAAALPDLASGRYRPIFETQALEINR